MGGSKAQARKGKVLEAATGRMRSTGVASHHILTCTPPCPVTDTRGCMVLDTRTHTHTHIHTHIHTHTLTCAPPPPPPPPRAPPLRRPGLAGCCSSFPPAPPSCFQAAAAAGAAGAGRTQALRGGGGEGGCGRGVGGRGWVPRALVSSVACTTGGTDFDTAPTLRASWGGEQEGQLRKVEAEDGEHGADCRGGKEPLMVVRAQVELHPHLLICGVQRACVGACVRAGAWTDEVCSGVRACGCVQPTPTDRAPLLPQPCLSPAQPSSPGWEAKRRAPLGSRPALRAAG